MKAAKHGYLSSSHGQAVTPSKGATRKSDHLVLRADKSLLRDLEIREWGQPVALGAVFVCLLFSLFCLGSGSVCANRYSRRRRCGIG
jgi:hypothetical protein